MDKTKVVVFQMLEGNYFFKLLHGQTQSEINKAINRIGSGLFWRIFFGPYISLTL